MRYRPEIAFPLIVLALIAIVLFLPFEALVVHLQNWVAVHQQLAIWLIGAAFFMAVILLLPVAPIVLLAGFVFGWKNGFMVIWVSGALASTAAFWLGKQLARPWVQSRISKSSRFGAIDRVFELNGIWIVLMVRLSMVLPFGLSNYVLASSRVRFGDYAIGTNIGMIPAYFLVIYLGAAGTDLAELLSGESQLQPAEVAAFMISALLLVAVICLIGRFAVQALRRELDQSG